MIEETSSVEFYEQDGVWVVIAVSVRGEVFAYPVLFVSRERAIRFAARVDEARAIDSDLWNYVRTIYGSIAYEEDGHEEAQIEREREDARYGW